MKPLNVRTSRRIVGLFVFAALLSSATVRSAQAAISCHQINAKAAGQDLGGGMTEANVIGGGLLHGTTQANFAIVGGTAPVFTISGSVVFTTNHGNLTASVSGPFDLSTGAFNVSGTVTSATDKLAGATGALSFDGIEDLISGQFAEDITGQICVDLAP